MNNIEVSHFESLYPAESRSFEIEKILSYVKKGDSCQILGLPGVGQSTCLKLLAYNKSVRLKHLNQEQDKFHFVLTDISEVRKKPLLEITKYMFLSLVDSLRERRLQTEYEETYSILKESLALNDELVIFQGLKNAIDYLTLEKDLTIVFLLDRFETYIPSLTDDFFSNLRVLRNRAKYKFSAVFSLVRPLEDSIEPNLMIDFSEFLSGHYVYLNLMDKPGMDFRINHLESLANNKLTDELKESILQITSGLGRLAKNCVQLSLAVSSPLSHEVNELTQLFLSNNKIKTILYDIWLALSPSEQDFLKANKEYSQNDTDYPYLANVGLLTQGKIAIPLFKSFVEKTLLEFEPKVENEKIVFDSKTNEIKQGTTIISDKLTSSEFRLLLFLLQQQETIIDRESIINAVWKDAVSTEGVTDQALDQLLFRIRKKIEDDPNNPKHIQTIKGRGVRFIS